MVKSKDNRENCEEGCCDSFFEHEEKVREEYEKLCTKYGLVSFKELNEDFDIDVSDLNIDTPLRDVRKAMVLKFSGFLNLIELLLNPTNGQMLNMFMSRGIGVEEKKILDKLFDILGEIVISSLSLDLEYSEKKEAEFIKSNFKKWQEVKKDALVVIGKIQDSWGKKEFKKEKSYFG
ncbi:MAG: hypothetical protein WC796_02305 [Candidatus Pacearchaeota archaeon]